MLSRVAFALSLVLFTSAALAQTPPADPDFAVQGEYTGAIGQAKLGVQVIALGGGEFDAVFYPDGLPGDGWTKDKKKEKAHGKTADGATAFKAATWSGTIKDGAMTITDAAGKELGKLPKVLRKSPTLGAKPPQGEVVLFDGASGDEWTRGGNKPAVENGLLCQGVTSKKKFQSCTLHLEFLLPFEPKGRGQGRGNSGVYLQGRYETQVLDSFGLEGKNNEAGGIYTISDPIVNMCFPPMSWQTYDIEFTAARYENGKKVEDGRMTVKHNGVLVQDNVKLPKATTAAPVREGAEPGPIFLQDHGHPVRYQNVWVVEKK